MLIAAVSIPPLAAAETAIVSSRSSWEGLIRPLGMWTAIATAVFFPLIYGTANGRKAALYLMNLLGVVWCAASGIMAIRMLSPNIGFFTVFLILFWFMIGQWLQYDLGRPFFDPGIRWYQGLPPTIPGIRCLLTQGPHQIELKVSRLDHDGAFVFSPDGNSIDLNASNMAELQFFFRNRQIRCQGAPVRVLKTSAGFCFSDIPPDTKKDLGDFVETLRGEGYVL